MGLLVILLVVVPIVEIYVGIQVAQEIGWLVTLGLVVLVSVVGAWLVKVQGLGVLARAERRAARGEIPGRELVDGILILLAGLLLLTPGFVTDAFGILLLLPPVRAGMRGAVRRRYGGRVRSGRIGNRFTAHWIGGDVVEGEVVDEEPRRSRGYGRPSIDPGDDTA